MATSVPLFSFHLSSILPSFTLPMHRHELLPLLASLPVYLLTSPCLSVGQGTKQRLSYRPGWGRALNYFWCVTFFSCHRLYLILFPSLNGEKKPVFLVCSDCGLLGQGGSHKPSQSETLWSRFFDLLLFIALVVMEWKTVYLYSNGVNLKKKSTII